MRNEEKNKWKQKSSNLPLGIKAKVGLAVKVGAVTLGFHVWGIDFIWVVLGFTFCYDILRGIFSCLRLSLVGSEMCIRDRFWASRSVMTSCGAFSPALFLSWL